MRGVPMRELRSRDVGGSARVCGCRGSKEGCLHRGVCGGVPGAGVRRNPGSREVRKGPGRRKPGVSGGQGGGVCGPGWRLQARGAGGIRIIFVPPSPRAGPSRINLLARGGVPSRGAWAMGISGCSTERGPPPIAGWGEEGACGGPSGAGTVLPKRRRPLSSLGRRLERELGGEEPLLRPGEWEPSRARASTFQLGRLTGSFVSQGAGPRRRGGSGGGAGVLARAFHQSGGRGRACGA